MIGLTNAMHAEISISEQKVTRNLNTENYDINYNRYIGNLPVRQILTYHLQNLKDLISAKIVLYYTYRH